VRHDLYGFGLNPINFEGLMVEAVYEVFVHPVRIDFFEKLGQRA
jgi:hypothetical protein